jgi:hypothetical protein
MNLCGFAPDGTFQFHCPIQEVQDLTRAQLLRPQQEQALHRLGLQPDELLEMPLGHFQAGLGLGLAVDSVLLRVPGASPLDPVVLRRPGDDSADRAARASLAGVEHATYLGEGAGGPHVTVGHEGQPLFTGLTWLPLPGQNRGAGRGDPVGRQFRES